MSSVNCRVSIKKKIPPQCKLDTQERLYYTVDTNVITIIIVINYNNSNK